MTVQAVILAAGMGTRLGKPWPKPLTPLADGRTIMRQQMDNLAGFVFALGPGMNNLPVVVYQVSHEVVFGREQGVAVTGFGSVEE